MTTRSGTIASKAFLLKEMVVRDVRSRYAGSSLGLLWAFAHPGALDAPLHRRVLSGSARSRRVRATRAFPNSSWPDCSRGWRSRKASRARPRCSSTTPRWSRRRSSRSRRWCSRSCWPPSSTSSSLSPSSRVYVALVGHLSLAWLLLIVPALLLQILLTFGLGCIAATLTAFVRDTAHAVGIVSDGRLLRHADRVSGLARARAPAADPRGQSGGAPRRPLSPGVHAARAAPAGSILYLTLFCGLVALLGAALFARARPHFADLI